MIKAFRNSIGTLFVVLNGSLFKGAVSVAD